MGVWQGAKSVGDAIHDGHLVAHTKGGGIGPTYRDYLGGLDMAGGLRAEFHRSMHRDLPNVLQVRRGEEEKREHRRGRGTEEGQRNRGAEGEEECEADGKKQP